MARGVIAIGFGLFIAVMNLVAFHYVQGIGWQVFFGGAAIASAVTTGIDIERPSSRR